MEEERRGTKVLRLLALAVPLILGVWGFLQAGESLLNALFTSLTMYTLEYQEVPPNLPVELARWTAPLATASGIFLAFGAVRQRLRNLLRYRRGNSVAVYGPDARRAPLLKALAGRGIDGGEELDPAGRLVRAQRYILLGTEEENFAFYTAHAPQLTKSEVWLQCSSLPAQSAAPAGLHLFCPEETAARLYWKEQSLYPLARTHGHRLRLAFIGFGRLGEELLSAGLQNNVFAPDQRIEYHIFGPDGGFAALHTGLGEISDPVLFHPEPWQQSLPLLEEADLVLVLEQQAQPALVRALLLALHTPCLTVFAADPALLGLLDGQQRLFLFDWRGKAGGLDAILSDALFLRAKRINLRYAWLYREVTEENDKNREERWQALDAFTRYSNISAADYHDVRLAMLAERGETLNALSAGRLEELAVLEHIRWCRYHWLNNWRYGQPASGKAKDAANRIHADLVPYEQLPEEEKEKDRSNIRLLCELG